MRDDRGSSGTDDLADDVQARVDPGVSFRIIQVDRRFGDAIGQCQRPIQQGLKLVVAEVAAEPLVLQDSARGSLLPRPSRSHSCSPSAGAPSSLGPASPSR